MSYDGDMLYIRPSYYNEFECIAGECPDTCCAGWQVDIDDAQMEKYRKMSGTLGELLKKNINEEKKCFYNDPKTDRCSFLDDDNLCILYKHAQSESVWCETCRMYPRHIEEFENVREISLGLSCPESSRILLSKKETIRFSYEEDDTEEAYDEFDYLLYDKLVEARKVLFSILQDRRFPTRKRASLSLLLTGILQQELDEDRIFDMDDTIAHFREKKGQLMDGVPVQTVSDRFKTGFAIFDRLEQLEPLRQAWKERRERARGTLYAKGEKAYGELLQAFHQEWEEGEGRREELEIIREHLLVYFVFIYFCGSVYDDQILNKMRLATFSADLLEELFIASWEENGHQLSLEDEIWITHAWCRELEHADENLNLLEDMLS